jgi:pimeloyl-ACP methyl ester carboxylesterase
MAGCDDDTGASDDGGSAGSGSMSGHDHERDRDAGPETDHDHVSDQTGENHDAGSRQDHDEDAGPAAPTMRAQDARKFSVDEASLPFDALPNAPEADRYYGTLDGSGYRIEVPKNWNGMLVMYAHGYAGTGDTLKVTTPSIRRHLLEQGYAWAASSYSKNYYDVQVGVEDTNDLAQAFKRLVADGGRTIDEPKKRYLIGHSMGGHITAAAIEREAQQTEEHKVHYDGALPMCGVVGDTDLFTYFGAYQEAALELTGHAADSNFADVSMMVRDALWTAYPSATTDAGNTLKEIVQNLTGGKRPMFDLGFANKGLQDAVWSTFGGDGTIAGILLLPGIDTENVVYQLDDDPAQSSTEKDFNKRVGRMQADPDANALRNDGLRYIPKVNGDFDIPVVTLHTLGDLYVPFHMEQVYRQRAIAKGNGDRLVQRAIRGTGHCEFTLAEQVAGFDALIAWEQKGEKPEGDDVLDPAVVGASDYGCKFTDNTVSDDEKAAMSTIADARAAAPKCD